MMEYEKLRVWLETLNHQLALTDRRLSRSALWLQTSMEQTQITQKAAVSLEKKFAQISRDLAETEAGIMRA